jgi:hypothetical protein
VTAAPFRGAADDLDGFAAALLDAAPDLASRGAELLASAVRAAPYPGPYRYGSKLAAAVKATPPRAVRGGVAARVTIGGSRAVFSGGASVRDVLWGAEFGARGGDVVRVSLSTGTSRTVDASTFGAYAGRAQSQHTVLRTSKRGRVSRRTVTAGTAGASRTRITGVRRGGLSQFPARDTAGVWATPALDAAQRDLDRVVVELLEGVLTRGRA